MVYMVTHQTSTPGISFVEGASLPKPLPSLDDSTTAPVALSAWSTGVRLVSEIWGEM